MTRDRWLDTVALIKDRFPILAQGTEPREEGPGTVEFVEFEGPAGHLRLEFVTHPVILGKKAVGGKRVGIGTKTQYQFSDTDQVTTFRAWKKVNDDWEEFDASMFADHA